ncbi:MAG: hypothetical protein Q9211_001282 [Gyalolechia sp. 1 TL-2023]
MFPSWLRRPEGILASLLIFTIFAYFVGRHTPLIHPIDRQTNHDRLGAVASEKKLCTQIGIDLLKAGGNAADAVRSTSCIFRVAADGKQAIGTTLCVGVINMYHSGIGGGGVALVRSPNGTFESIDFRETAPAAADVDMFKDNVEGSLHGGLASGVPGQLRGLEYIHQQYGKLPWSNLVRPSVELARKGFRVSEDLVHAMGIPKTHDRRSTPNFGTNNLFLTDDPAWAADFAPNGTRLGLGDLMTRERYANTLEEIAETGVDSFYTGVLATQIAAAVSNANGSMTASDLAGYNMVARRPVEIDFHGYRILACGVPASGAIVLSILKAIEGYVDFAAPEKSNTSTHRLVEAMRFGYGKFKRASFGDSDFLADVPELENSILSDSYAASIRSRILDDRTQNVSAYDPDGFENHYDHGTSQISAADASGLAISLTTTVNLFFGSHVMVPQSGIIMNNQMNDFSIPSHSNQFGYRPSPANYIAPRKRPLSSMSPLMAASKANPDEMAIFGAAGGSRIITAVAQNVLDILLHNMTTFASVKEARLHDQLVPNFLYVEWDYDNATVEMMRERGHEVERIPPGYSSACIVRRLESGAFDATAEVRQTDSAGMVV